MFPFAAWDQKRRRLVAARDRLGVKPLYYRELEGGLAFASEAKALLEIGRPAVDMSALRDVLTYGYIPAPKSAWTGIRKLPAGHTLVWEDGRLTIDRYWNPEARIEICDMGEATERLDALFTEIVPLHTLADVPVGVFLSGGIDSTSMTAFLTRPRTFTLGQDVAHRSEAPAARRAAEYFGTIHREETARAMDLERALDIMPTLYDEPFGDSAAWLVWLVSELARKDVTVALAGEGADELFCGYQWYSRFFEPEAGILSQALAHAAPPFTDFGRSLHRRTSQGLERYGTYLTVFNGEQRQALFGPHLATAHDDDLWSFRRYWRDDLDPIRRMQWVDLHTYIPAGRPAHQA
jgi:asparagine synthase (glutamine-hydrolysing)